jgi:hypothetical protein
MTSLTTWRAHSKGITSIDFVPYDDASTRRLVVTSSTDSNVSVWHLETGTLYGRFSQAGHGGPWANPAPRKQVETPSSSEEVDGAGGAGKVGVEPGAPVTPGGPSAAEIAEIEAMLKKEADLKKAEGCDSESGERHRPALAFVALLPSRSPFLSFFPTQSFFTRRFCAPALSFSLATTEDGEEGSFPVADDDGADEEWVIPVISSSADPQAQSFETQDDGGDGGDGKQWFSEELAKCGNARERDVLMRQKLQFDARFKLDYADALLEYESVMEDFYATASGMGVSLWYVPSPG